MANLKRVDLQALAKHHGIRANQTSEVLIRALQALQHAPQPAKEPGQKTGAEPPAPPRLGMVRQFVADCSAREAHYIFQNLLPSNSVNVNTMAGEKFIHAFQRGETAGGLRAWLAKTQERSLNTIILYAPQNEAQLHDRALLEDGQCVFAVFAVAKRGPPVDSRCAVAQEACVVADENGDGFWDAQLNQPTDFGTNKCYRLQLVCSTKKPADVFVFFLWGRVGGTSQFILKGPFPLEAAQEQFQKKFYAKTKVEWQDRANFVRRAGKYALLEPYDHGELEISDDALESKGR